MTLFLKKAIAYGMAAVMSFSVAGSCFAANAMELEIDNESPVIETAEENWQEESASSEVTVPDETLSPGETPEPTETPEPSETPVPTETPDPSETPAPTETPEPSETPTPSETPAEEEEPENYISADELEGVIEEIVQAASNLLELDEQELAELCQKIEQVRSALESLEENQRTQMAQQEERFENAAAAVLDYQQVLQALADGTLDELEQTGQENSWRYQNGQQVDTQGSVANFAAGIQTFSAGGYTGIDVSHHNGTVNWQAVKNAGIDFAIIRCGYGDNLTNQDDAQWARNVSECERLGIPYGVYLYSYSTSVSQAKSEAQHALRLLEGRQPALPVFIDYEESRNLVGGTALLGDMAKTFCDTLQAAGYEVGVYASLSWWQNYLVASEFQNESWYRWVARWGSSSGYGGRHEMWQYTSDGSVSGVSGRVDMNIWYGSTLWLAPEEPILQSAAYTSGGVQITWKKAVGATGYRVYRQTASGGWSKLQDVTGLSYTDTTATADQKYTYTVKAYKKTSGKTVWGSYDADGITIEKLQAPKLTAATNAASGITISWNKVSGASGYRVYKLSDEGRWVKQKDVTSLSYTDTTAKSGELCTYTVKSYRKVNGVVSWGDYDGKGISVTRLAMPKLTSAANIGDGTNGVQVTWNEVSGADGYRIYHRAPGEDWVKLTNLTGTSYLDTTAKAGVEYDYTVRAYKIRDGVVEWGPYDKNGLSVVVLPAPELTGAVNASNGVTISWEKVSGATGYRVYKLSDEGRWVKQKDLTSLTYTDATAQSGKVNTYTVKAYRKVNNILTWGNYNGKGISVTRLATPKLTSAANIGDGTNGVQVTWNEVSGADGYRIYHRAPGEDWVKLTNLTGTSYLDTTAKAGVEYDYTVRAYKIRDGVVEWGPYDKNGLSVVVLPAPELTRAVNVSNGVTISWNKVSGATGYRVYKLSDEGRWVKQKDVTSLSYTDTTAQSGETCVYTVKAYRKVDGVLTWGNYDGKGISIIADAV